jgi:hypothetical protein
VAKQRSKILQRNKSHDHNFSRGALPKNLTYIGKTILCVHESAGIWRSITNKISGNKIITIFTCRILETLRSIVPAITQKNKFLVYEAEWNYVKVNRDGKCKLVMLSCIIFFLISVANTHVIIL